LEITPVSRHEGNLARGRDCRDQDIAELLALAPSHGRPDFSCYAGSVTIERKDDTISDERLECMHLSLERLAVANRTTISPQTFEYSD
jgi:hypothetical protein